MARRCKPARGEKWGILNPYGDVWTYDTFSSEAGALDYVEQFWASLKGQDTSRFKIVKVRVTVSYKAPTPPTNTKTSGGVR